MSIVDSRNIVGKGENAGNLEPQILAGCLSQGRERILGKKLFPQIDIYPSNTRISMQYHQ